MSKSAAPRHIAFLRAINVGGRNVTMDKLRSVFESLGFSDVATFIASGNVIFGARAKDRPALERKIETRLHDALGYEVRTFLRTEDELAAIVSFRSFAESKLRTAGALNVGFLAAPLDATLTKALLTLRTDIDDFSLNGCEMYWLCKKKQSDSKFSSAVFERKLRTAVTFRGLRTLERLTVKYPAPSRENGSNPP